MVKQTSEPLPMRVVHTFDRNYPPERLAFNGRKGSRLVCVLGAEGRRLQVVDRDQVGARGAGDVEMG